MVREEPTPRGSLVSSRRGRIWSFYDNVIDLGLRGVHGAAVTVWASRARQGRGDGGRVKKEKDEVGAGRGWNRGRR